MFPDLQVLQYGVVLYSFIQRVDPDGCSCSLWTLSQVAILLMTKRESYANPSAGGYWRGWDLLPISAIVELLYDERVGVCKL